MIKYIVIYASYQEAGEGLGASVLIFDTEEQAQQNLKESYDMVLKDFERGTIEWNELDKTSDYSIGGYDLCGYRMNFQAYIDKKEVN